MRFSSKITEEEDLRDAFWAQANHVRDGYRKQNNYPADVRMEWIDFVDIMVRDKIIDEDLARSSTL